MNNKKIIIPISLCGILAVAVIALSVSNASLRRDLAGVRAERAADAAAVSNSTESATAAVVANAAKAAAETALEKLNRQPLAAVSASPYYRWGESYIRVRFQPGRGVSAPKGEAAFSFDPPVSNVVCNAADDCATFKGDFVPGEVYTLTLNPGWKNAEGGVLEKPARLTFKGPNREPFFSLAVRDNCYWPASRQAMKIPFTSFGITNLCVSVSRAYDSNIPLFGTSGWSQSASARPIAEFNLPVALAPAKMGKTPGFIDLGAGIEDPKPGIYFIEVDPQSAYKYDSYWRWEGTRELVFALTDMAISAAADAGGGSVTVFVNSFADGTPVAGAKVTVMTKKHQVAATGATGADGMAHLDTAVDSGDNIQYVIAEKGGDISCLDLDIYDSYYSQTRTLKGSSDGAREHSKIRAFVFSEREICRPGEKFTSSVFVRTAAKDGAKAMAGAPVALSLVDSSGKTVGSRRVKVDAFGFASAEWEIPKNAGLGRWRVRCDVGDSKNAGSLAMDVRNYVPDRLKATLVLPEGEIVGIDSPVAISGKAAYYFGEPLSEGFCKLTAEPCYADTPKHLRDWRFGSIAEVKDYRAWTSSLPLGEDGTFTATYDGLASNGLSKVFLPMELEIAADIQEPGGPTVSAKGSVVFHPTPYYVALREREGGGPAFDIALKPAIAGGGADNAEPVEVKVSLEREVWTRNFVKRDNGTIAVEWDSKMVKVESADRTVTIPAGAVAGDWMGLLDYSGALPEGGYYLLTATAGDSLETSFGFWHWAGEVSERSADPHKFVVEAGAPSYAPGDSAVLSFASPYNGSAYVVAGASGIEDSFAVAVTQGLNKVTVQIPKTLLAGKYHAALTVVSSGDGEPKRATGHAAIAVDCSGSRRLKVTLGVPELARPDSDAVFEVSLADATGAPASGLVSIAALDEGAAALTRFHVADPFAFFFSRSSGVPFSMWDCYNMVFPDLRIMPDGTFGGDDMAGSARSLNISDSLLKGKTTVRFVLPPVEVGTNGHATVTARIPDHTGALRIMAVASDELRVGSAEESLVVRAPVSVLATAPRFAAGGDSFVLTASLFNHDAAAGDASLRIELPEGVSAADDGSRVLAFSAPGLAPGSSVVFQREVKVAADASGALDIPFAMTLGDCAAKDCATVNVRPARPVETVSSFSVVTNGSFAFRNDAAAWLGRADTTLTLSATPAAALATSLAWLGEYPYGCLEQTVSGAFPFVVAGDLEKLGLIDGTVRKASEAKVALAYALVLQLHRGSGFMSMWPWSADTWREGSLYAAHFIFEADKAGLIDVDSGVREILQGMLRRVAEDARPENRVNSAYASYALAVSGDISFINSARNIVSAGRQDWPTFLASAAMLRGGFASEGVGPFAGATLARAWEGRDGGDAARNAGMALFIAAKSGIPDLGTLAPAASRLLSSLRPDGSAWGTTDKNAWATLGLAAYAARLGAAPARGGVSIGGEKLPFDLSKGPATFAIPLGADVSVEADAPFFAIRSTVGVPAEPSADRGRISITRRYVDADGKDVASIAKGDLVTAVVEVCSPFGVKDAVLVDMIPGGFEIEDGSLQTRSTLGAYSLPANAGRLGGASEKRNDRWIWFGDLAAGSTNSATFHLRAVTPGRYASPTISIEAMYDPDAFGRQDAAAGSAIEVK